MGRRLVKHRNSLEQIPMWAGIASPLVRSIGSGVIGCLLSISLVSQVYASTSTTASPSPQLVINQQTGAVPFVDGVDEAAWPSIVSQAAVVMDMNTGTIVYGKNPLVSHYPASITKIMTALLALKLGHLTDTLTASADAVSQPPDKLYMVPGEKAQLEPLLYGMLLDSANDVAVEIAQNYGQSVSHFAQMMNDEAKSLGATHTHFVNPNGLPDPNHVTTAYDMAVISRAAMQYPEFRKIVGTKYYNWKGSEWQSKLSNLNSMLFYYPGCIGLKTGFTSVAHETLVVAATRGSDTFLAVLMDAPTDYEIRHDASQLLDYAFAHYQTETLLKAGQVVGNLPGGSNTKATLLAGGSVEATVLRKDPIVLQDSLAYSLPAHAVGAGTQVARLHLTDGSGKILGTLPVTIGDNWTPIETQNPVRLKPIVIPLAAVFVFLILFFRRAHVRRRRRRQAQIPRQSGWRSRW